jgi:hypothetical protein
VLNDIDHLQTEINNILEEEDLKWKQMAKEHWLKNGDKNTKFYHACVNQRRKANQIEQIVDASGRLCSSDCEIKEAFNEYFVKLFSLSEPTCMELCLEGVPLKVTAAMNESLLKPCTFEEVSEVVGQMADLKAPGPDGLPVEFFHDNWGAIGQELFSIVSEFFSH